MDCKYEERVEEYQISTPMLKTYTIKKNVRSRYDDKYFDLSVVRVDTKSLVYFNCHGNVEEVYCIENANAVVEAVLHVDEVCDCTFAHILPDFSSVKILHLSGLILEVLKEEFCYRIGELMMFANLLRVYFSFSECAGWLPTLLRSSPLLQTLIISLSSLFFFFSF